VVAYDRTDYRPERFMTLSPRPRRTRFWVVAVAVCLVPAVLAAQKKVDKKQQEAQDREVQTLAKLVDAAAAGQPAPADFPIGWHNDFLKAQEGRTYVPFTLTIDPAKLPPQPIAMYIRVLPRGGETAAAAAAPATDSKDRKDRKDDKKKDESPYPFHDAHFIEVKPPASGQPIRVSRAFSVAGGEYDVYVAVKERAPEKESRNQPPQKTSVLKQPVSVPDYHNGELATSSVILADRADPLQSPYTQEEQPAHPYALGTLEIVPAADPKFAKTEELLIFVQIYNPNLTPEGKPDLEVEYNFHQKAADGSEKYFNRTPPQQFNTKTLPAEFDAKAGYQISAAQGIPLAIFPEGDYRLEIKITDKLSGKALKREAAFTVVAS
jgi:hypothetical protein